MKKINIFITLLALIYLMHWSLPSQAAPKSHAKYKQCRLKCIEKDEKCTKKSKRKKEPVKGNIKCLTKKNTCLEKCSNKI